MAHNLKIAGAEYADVSKVTFTDTSGSSRVYVSTDEVYTKEQTDELIKEDRNKTREIAITTCDTDTVIWVGDEADVTLASGQPNDTYLLWVESI